LTRKALSTRWLISFSGARSTGREQPVELLLDGADSSRRRIAASQPLQLLKQGLTPGDVHP
jgi:hypothetical protein